MSTIYVTQEAMTVEAFEAHLISLGWEKGEYEGRPLIGDGTHYIHDVGPTEVENGDMHVGFICYAGNYPSTFEDDIPLWNEHEEGFWELCGGDEEDDDIVDI